MKKFKKVLTLATMATVAMTSLAGCSSNKDEQANGNAEKVEVNVNVEGYPIVEEPISLNAFAFGEPGSGDWDDYPVFAELAEKTNVNVTFETVTGDGASEKLNLVLASNKLPDVFFSGLSDTMINKYASMGLFMPLNDLIDNYAPNIKKLLEENPEIKKAITMPDGNIYALPAVNGNLDGNVPTKLYINKTWLDKLGLEVPKTTEEFEAVLKAFKTQDPNGNNEADEIPFTYEPTPPYNVWNGDTGMSGAFGVVDQLNQMMVQGEDLVYTPVQEGYKEYIKWTNSLYEQGLIDSEIFTQDHNMYMAKRSSDYLGAYLTHGPAVTDGIEWICIEPLEGPNGDKMWSQFDHTIDKNRAIISATNQYPEATMRYLDSFFDMEHSLDLRYGSRVTTTEDGKFNVAPDSPDLKKDAPGPYVPTLESADMLENHMVRTDDQIAAAERYALYEPFLAEPVPNITFTPEESKELSTLQTDLSNYATEMKAKWTTGQSDIDADWDSYIQTLNNMGLERYIEIYNAAYDRYLSH